MYDALDTYKLLDKLDTPIFVLKVTDFEKQDFKLIYANEANIIACGVDLKKFIGVDLRTNFPGLYEVGLADKYFESVITQKTLEVGEVVYGDENVNRSAYTGKATPISEDTVMITYKDISALKEAEQKLLHQNRVLKEKNKSLEEFAYITSHDLQEPLNTISSFVEILLKTYDERMNDNCRQILGHIGSSTTRLKNMIISILEYSRLGNQKEKMNIDCNLLVQEIQEDFKTLLDSKEVKLHISNLPSVNGSASEMRMLFQNLISNAIKYQERGNIPEVSINVEDNQQGYWIFSVTDNGIGIAENDRQKIFKMFHRLHLQQEYQGVGIGLANCLKIVQNHNGKIWVESVLRQGSTFYFTIPY
ncbi:ATP-binding protein [Flammeovirga sp. EKP202]|uniref:sensor histidine kinase n=1 Tax=Flammeovirga sp. EKP202 TaxID=2770592 RepID=UPI00165FA369|nr:ATP-binding protein [Flammeovirga sp. EKP202]MBD0399784.1 GHKL domain-containing protein [Flammeovirga sp. EKP202]